MICPSFNHGLVSVTLAKRLMGHRLHAESIMLEERQNQTVTKLHEISRPFLLRRIKKQELSVTCPRRRRWLSMQACLSFKMDIPR